MTDVDYEVRSGEYGEVVSIEFDYDERLTERIKKLREDPLWEQCHCQPVWTDGDEFEYWTVDRTEESLKLLAETTGLVPPDEVWPGGEGPSGEGDVVLEVPEGSTRFYVRGDDSGEVAEHLDMAFSYRNPDAEHSSMVPERIHVFDRQRGCAPMGLVRRAASAVEALGYDVTVEVNGDRSGPRVFTEWSFPHDLREYQVDAIDAVLDSGGGVVAIPTGGGKTVTALRLVDLVGQRAIVFVHTKELLHQWADEVRENLGVEPGVIGDGEWSEGPVTVCTMQTLMSKGQHRLGEYGMAFFDECHRTSAADTMHDIGMAVDVEWRIGLSATPWRRVSGAELKIEGAVGGKAHEVTPEELVELGHLAEPRFEVIRHGGPKARRSEEYHDAYRRCIEESVARNEAVAERASELSDEGYRVLVNVDRVDQGGSLAEAIPGAEFLCGSDRTPRREEVLSDFEEGRTPVLVSTLIKEGVDIPAIDAVILAHGGRSDISTLQVIGRALRPQGGKDHALIVDVEDEGRFFGRAHSERQATMAEYYGEYGPDHDEDEVDMKSTDDDPGSLADPISDEDEAEMKEWLGLE